MKKKYNTVVLHSLIIVLLSINLILVFNENWIQTTFRASSNIEVIINEKGYYIPVVKNTAIKYKTSDVSFVCVSRGNMKEIEYFYSKTKKYNVRFENDTLLIMDGQVSFFIKKIADDLKYVKYSISADG